MFLSHVKARHGYDFSLYFIHEFLTSFLSNRYKYEQSIFIGFTRSAVVNHIQIGREYCTFFLNTNTFKLPCLPVILKFQLILTKKIEGKSL